MHPAWLLAIKSASERRSRTILLVLAVMLSAALITAVTLGLHSVNKGLEARLARTVGSGDLRIKATGGRETFDADVQNDVLNWPQVASVAPRLQKQLILEIVRPVWEREKGVGPNPDVTQLGFERKFKRVNSSLSAVGVTDADRTLRPLQFVEGRWPEADDEVVVDELVVRQLGARGRVKVDAKEPISFQLTEPSSNETDVKGPADSKVDMGPATFPPDTDIAAINAQYNISPGKTVFAVRQLGDSVPKLQKLADALGIKRPSLSAAPLKVVGIVKQPDLGGRAQAFLTLAGLEKLTDSGGQISELDIVLKKGENANSAVAAHKAELPKGLLLQTTEKITSGISKNLAANRLVFTVASMFAFLGAAFIIMTAMSTAVTERQRELAMLRCIGASRLQLAQIQLLQGLIVGGIGAVLGVPLGIAMAEALFWYYKSEIRINLTIAPERVALAFAGALLAGILGAAFPAIQSSRIAPLKALASRAKLASTRGLVITAFFAIFGIALNFLSSRLTSDADTVFWTYIVFGIPGLLIGYFLLCVPLTLVLTAIFSRSVSRIIGLPPVLLQRTIRATPYRFGFTSGSLMAGLALMIALWTQGRGIMEDYIANFKFPDVFVLSLNGLSPLAQPKLDAMKQYVAGTNSISLVAMESNAKFGVGGVAKFKTTYIGFEPDRFFDLARLQFIEGDQETAKRRMLEGGAIIVAREFKTSNNLGVGSKLTLTYEDKSSEFEIVGVVTSPGLDLISKYFQIGDEYVDQAINSVFGSRADLQARFFDGIPPPTRLINVALLPKVDERAAIEKIRLETIPLGAIEVGSGRRILNDITGFLQRAITVSSAVAILAMIVASFGVANLIIAGINARQFEFGVLRAVGAPRGLLTKLVLGEAIIIGLTACVVGTLMGSQAVFVGRHIDEIIFGFLFTSKPPLIPTLLAWTFVISITLIAAAPAVISLAKRGPRELLASIRG